MRLLLAGCPLNVEHIPGAHHACWMMYAESLFRLAATIAGLFWRQYVVAHGFRTSESVSRDEDIFYPREQVAAL